MTEFEKMGCKGIILSLALVYQPIKKIIQSAYGDSDIGST